MGTSRSPISGQAEQERVAASGPLIVAFQRARAFCAPLQEHGYGSNVL